MTVLRWIRSDARAFKPFIAHRLGEILETTDVVEWRYVPTKLNVADDPTRDSEPADLTRGSRWFNGPEFLKEDSSSCPNDVDTSKLLISNEDLETKVFAVNVFNKEDAFVQINKYSSFPKLVRVTAYVLQLVKLFQNKALETKSVLATY